MHPDESHALISSIEQELREEQQHLLLWKKQIEERIQAIQKLLDTLKCTHPNHVNDTEIKKSESFDSQSSYQVDDNVNNKNEIEDERPDYHKVEKKQKTPPRNFREKLSLWKSMEGMKSPEKSASLPNFNNHPQLKRRSVVLSPKPITYPVNDDLPVVSSLSQIGEPCVRGVSFRFLKEFIDSVPPTYTTTDVVLKVIIPKTKANKCAFIQGIDTHFIGKPTFYVSHRWESKIHFVYNLLKSFMEQHKDGYSESETFFWIDIFALNQHREEAIDDIAQVEKTITQCKSTLFCLDEEGLALTRTWCLFELWRSVVGLDIPKVVLLMSSHSWQLHELFLFFNVDNSETSVSNDRIRLLKEMTSQTNSQQTTSLIKNALLKSSLEYASSHKSPESIIICAILHRAAGRFDVAEDKARQAYAMVPNSPDAQSLLVHILLATGQFQEAHLISEELLKTRIEQFGIEHPAVAVAMNNLAQSLHCMGNYQQAELYSVGSLKMNQKLLGLEHPDTVTSMEILAYALSCQNKHEEAETIYQRLLNIRKAQFGNLHLCVATSMHNLASSMKTQGKFADAEQLYQESLHIRKKLLGSDHPQVIYTMLNLSNALQHQEKFAEAQSMFQNATEIRKKLLQTASDPSPEFRRIIDGSIVEHYIDSTFRNEQELSWEEFEHALKIYAKASAGNCSGVKFCLVNKEGKVPYALWKRFVSWFRPLSLPDEWSCGVGLLFQHLPNGFTIHEVASIVEPDYFFGLMSASDARAFLKTQPNGSFLVRFSGSQVGSYTLSAKHFEEVSHWAFDYVKSEISYFSIREQPDMYPSLGRLVTAFSRQNGVALYFKEDARPRYLEHPINRNALMQPNTPTNKTVYAEFLNDNNNNNGTLRSSTGIPK